MREHLTSRWGLVISVVGIAVGTGNIWRFAQVIQAAPSHWWNPFAAESVGTCLFQWTLVIMVFVAANRFIVERTLSARLHKDNGEMRP
jgi:hypothetical protein